jgi:hypothetical protein
VQAAANKFIHVHFVMTEVNLDLKYVNSSYGNTKGILQNLICAI